MTYFYQQYEKVWNRFGIIEIIFILLLIITISSVLFIYPFGSSIIILFLAILSTVYIKPMIGVYILIMLYPLESFHLVIKTQNAKTVLVFFEEIYAAILLIVIVINKLNDHHKIKKKTEYYKKFPYSWINFLLSLFLFWSLFTIFRSPYYIISLYDFWKFFCSVIIIAFLVRHVDGYSKLNNMAICFCLFSVIYALSACVATHYSFYDTYPLLNIYDASVSLDISLFNKPAGYSAEVVGLTSGYGLAAKHELTLLLSSGILFAFYLIIVTKSFRMRGVLGILILLFITVIYQAFSRLSIVGMLCVVIFLCLVNPYWKKSCAIIFTLFIAMNVAGLFFSSLIRPSHMKTMEKSQEKIKAIGSTSKFTGSSMGFRMYIWEKSVERIIQDKGLGRGPGSLRREITFGYPNSHNLLLTLLVEYGFPGTLIIIILLLIIFTKTYIFVFVKPKASKNLWFLQLILVGIILQALFEYSFDLHIHSRHLWLMIGLLIASLNIKEKSDLWLSNNEKKQSFKSC